MGRFISGGNEGVLKDYIPTLYQLIMNPLKQEKIEETVMIMHLYNINPEMLKDHLINLQFGSLTCQEEYKAIPIKNKTFLGKLYNSLYKSSLQKVRKRKEREIKDKVDPEFLDEDSEESESEESELEIKPKQLSKKKR